jgi:hypothetical protein
MNIQMSQAHISHFGGDISALKRHGGWRSTAVVESYIEDSIENKKQTAMKILAPLDINKPSTSNDVIIL